MIKLWSMVLVYQRPTLPYTGGAKKMYTHFKRCYLCITFRSWNLTMFQKGVLYSGCKIYNKLLPHIKGLSNDLKRFKSTLKGFLMERTLYSTDEFYQITWNDYDSYQCYDLCMLYTVIYTIFTHIIWLIPCLQRCIWKAK
jgi:hypothetical protein